jgi:hypothetical protein
VGSEGTDSFFKLRFLLALSSRSDTDVDVETVFDIALTYVEVQEPDSQSGLMVLYLIVERWLDLIEYVLSFYSILIYVSP